jgi:maltooligosyltrehalose trehalohydrolase
MQVGSYCAEKDSCLFTVWAPFAKQVEVKVVAPKPAVLPMMRDGLGYWSATAGGIGDGADYLYRIDGALERPDPASSHQPAGVHGPSRVVDHRAFVWTDGGWQPPRLDELIIYEIHVGTFTPAGTFEAVIARLDDLRAFGVNAVELMPVAQFPGGRNWGYDGAYLFAVQHSYGGPAGLKTLVDACHRRGIAVVLDVVYNHFGPEGNYSGDFGPYLTAKYRTPWGNAVNYDDAYSYGVRNHIVENARYWLQTYHVDALRLDAVHGIFDTGARHILEEIAEEVEQMVNEKGRQWYLIAESDLNDPRVVRPRETGGYGVDAQWADDFHHALHTALTGERSGYYADYNGAADLRRAFTDTFVYAWRYSAERKRWHGSACGDIPASRFVVFSQNHDQVGNRMMGDRRSALVDFEGLKLAASAVLLSPYIPLLFMGEEYGAGTPFLYFVSHGDPGLIEAVRAGRKREFQGFAWNAEPPDPQSEDTFNASKLRWEERREGPHRVLLSFYAELIRLRKKVPALSRLDRGSLSLEDAGDDGVICLYRGEPPAQALCILNFNGSRSSFRLPLRPGRWTKLLDSSDGKWNGPGAACPDAAEGLMEFTAAPRSCALYVQEEI